MSAMEYVWLFLLACFAFGVVAPIGALLIAGAALAWLDRRIARRKKYNRMRVLYGGEPCPACGRPGALYDGHVCEDYRIVIMGDYLHPAGKPLTADEIERTLNDMEFCADTLKFIVPPSGPYYPHS